MNPDPDVDAVLFDIGDTLVHAAAPGTPVDAVAVHLRPQVAEDLHALADAGLRLGAVTDTSVMTETDVRALLAPSGLDALLEVVVTSVDVGAPKPDPRSLQTALDRLAVPPERTLFIGDRVVDRDAARAAGTRFAFVGDTIASTLAQSRSATGGEFDDALNRWSERDHDQTTAVAAEARVRIDSLAKPPGSLGRLEDLAVHLAAITGTCPPPELGPATVLVYAADHGVVANGVSQWPKEVTAAMAATIASGRASVNALAASVGAGVVAVDVGVASLVPHGPGLINRRVRPGTRNLAIEPAMTLAEVSQALDVGAHCAATAIDGGARCIAIGEMGIGNTTAAAAVICAYLGTDATELVGPGAGADEESMARKVQAIDAALDRSAPDGHPLEILASVGGLEIAAMVGTIVEGVSRRVPVVIDGVIADAALLAAEHLAPGVAGSVVAGHRSAEPAATKTLAALGLEPLLDLSMRLGEGTGAVLALPLLGAARQLLIDVATFDEVTGGPD